jgi:hypothetical protein
MRCWLSRSATVNAIRAKRCTRTCATGASRMPGGSTSRTAASSFGSYRTSSNRSRFCTAPTRSASRASRSPFTARLPSWITKTRRHNKSAFVTDTFIILESVPANFSAGVAGTPSCSRFRVQKTGATALPPAHPEPDPSTAVRRAPDSELAAHSGVCFTPAWTARMRSGQRRSHG